MESPNMPNSSAMLDSTISKILAAQQVEPSLTTLMGCPSLTPPNNQHQNANDPPSQPKILSSKEAEVRLVVRFTVEEHIVYQGTVKKINQLENEELTRVVSHVAWDSIKDIDTAEPIGDTCEAADKETALPEQENFKKQSTDPSTPNEFPQHYQESEIIQKSFIQPDLEVPSNSVTLSKSEVNEALHFDDHMIDKETRADVPTTTTTLTQPSPLLIEPHSDETTNHNPTDSPIQIQEQDSKTNSDSDTNNEQLLPTDIEIIHDPQTTPQIKHEPLEQPIRLDEDIFHEAMERISSQHLMNDEDTYIENQSIYDTLNDCINNVARETLFLEKTGSNPSTPTIDTPISIDAEFSRQHGSPDMKESSDDMTTFGRNSNESSRDGDLCDKIFLSDDLNDEARPLSNEPSSTSSSVSAETSQLGDKHPPVKRKSSNDNSSGKKMKRASLKGEKNLASRKSTPKTYENLAKKNDPSSTRGSSTMSLLMTNQQQQIRQNKVFAKWSDNHFYPGVIIKPAKDRKFVIGFVDGAQKDVAETDLIPLCNIEGKQVRVQIAKNYCYNAIVHDQRSTVNDQPMFEVEYQQDGLVKKCVSWKDIFLTGEQGIPLANQLDRNSGASNFADVDLDNIIYEKRSRRLQEMEEFYFTNSSPHRTKTSLLL